MSPTGQETLVGANPLPGDPFEGEVRVEALRWVSDDLAFAVAEVSLEDGSGMTAVGPLAHLEPGARARLAGRFEEHARHGMQIAAERAEPLDPPGAEGARRYLKTIPGIGGKRAEALIERFGEDVFEQIDRDPAAVFASLKGVSADRAAEAAADWEERRAQRRLYALLAPHGLARHVGELIAVHGSDALAAVREDPYGLTSLHGIGFLGADRLALSLGLEPDSPQRVQAAAVHALREAEQDGHTYLPIKELITQIRGLLGGVEPSIGRISSAPGVVHEGTLVYREHTWHAERWLGATLTGMARSKPAWSKPPLGGELEGLTSPQSEAVTNGLTRRLSVITGGPGTGKTHLNATLARIAEARGLELRLLAPTGRAARRLTQATGGAPASTIHKALEWVPGEIPGRDEDNPIEADLVIVDESSMLSLEIARHLVAAIGPKSHLILIGDADQLPPVGPGKPFCELIDSGIAPVVRLGHVFRQARRSMIVAAAHAIRDGEMPHSEPGPEEIHDFFMHGRRSAADLAGDVVRIAVERIPERYGLDPVREVQVLAPQYKGPLGIDELHARIRTELCGSAETVLEGRFALGEKLITTRSLPEAGVANGTVLVLDEYDSERDELLLENDLGELLRLPSRDARVLRGGFAVSVHKAQGFEIPAVIVCLHSSHAPLLLSRNLLYTAVTRAQRLCVLAGDRPATMRALRNTDALARHSRLRERLIEGGGSATGSLTG